MLNIVENVIFFTRIALNCKTKINMMKLFYKIKNKVYSHELEICQNSMPYFERRNNRTFYEVCTLVKEKNFGDP